MAGWARVIFSFFAGVLLYRAYIARKPKPLGAWHGVFTIAAMFVMFNLPRTDIVFALLSCFILCPIIVWHGARATVWPWLSSFCSWTGRISYALYITHKPLLEVFMMTARKIGINVYPHPHVAALLFTLGAVLMAALFDRFYDVPLRTYLGQKFRAKYVR